MTINEPQSEQFPLNRKYTQQRQTMIDSVYRHPIIIVIVVVVRVDQWLGKCSAAHGSRIADQFVR
jgi:hypothetical protein